MTRRTLLVIEDGSEYLQFARAFLGRGFHIRGARSAGQALEAVTDRPPDALLIDLRFERAPPGDLEGNVRETADRLFAGDVHRAREWLKDEQGTLILARLREAGCMAPALFVHDFAPRRLRNLQRLYGRVDAVPSFDVARIREALGWVA